LILKNKRYTLAVKYIQQGESLKDTIQFLIYTMHYRDGESTFQTHILVKYSKGKYNHKRVKYFAYAVYYMGVTVQKTFKEYRKVLA